MAIEIYTKEEQAYGAFNNGAIVENKPLGFPQDGGDLRPYSNLFYWANALAVKDSTIGLHPHQGFEIISFVLNGEIRHFDTKTNDWKPLNTGDVQIIRAGSGIKHAEFMAKDARMFQIWLDPNLNNTLSKEASYSDYKLADFPMKASNGISIKHIIGNGSPFQLDTPGILVDEITLEDSEISMTPDYQVLSIYILSGNVKINADKVEIDTFVRSDEELSLSGTGSFFVIKSPNRPEYLTYTESLRAR